MKAGDLVVVDGYFGIVKDIEERTVMLGNGLTQIVDEDEWATLRPVAMKPGAASPANFFEFLLISQQEPIFNYRRMLLWYIDHVGQCEGVSFLGDRYKPNDLTDDEWAELQELDQESQKC